jgi:hypothetical protein
MSFKKYIASLPRAEADEVSTPLLLDLSGNPTDITVAPCNGSGLGWLAGSIVADNPMPVVFVDTFFAKWSKVGY